MLLELLLLVVATLATYAFYKWGTANNDYFKDYMIKSLKPTFLLGNTGQLFFSKLTAVEFAHKFYYAFPDEP